MHNRESLCIQHLKRQTRAYQESLEVQELTDSGKPNWRVPATPTWRFSIKPPTAARPSRVLGCVFLLVALVGCVQNKYEIQMTTEGHVLRRQLVCSAQASAQQGESQLEPVADAEIVHIAASYERHFTREQGKKHIFLGSFTDKTPDDVGGAGSLTHWTTEMGTLTAYIERFRGNDDFSAVLRDRQLAADKLTDLLMIWMRAELQNQPHFAELQTFMRENFRRDLSNLVVYCWSAELVNEVAEDANQELLLRAALYLIERDYFTIEELPSLMRSFDQESDTEILAFVRRLLAAKLRIREPGRADAALAFLADKQSVVDSADRALSNTEFYQKYLAARKQASPDEEPSTAEMLTELLLEAWGFDLLLSHDQLNVKFACPHPPLWTNGEWKGETGQVVWSKSIEPRQGFPGHALPKILYAAWSDADEQFQKQHFGRTVLQADDLASYCMWRKQLSDSEAGEWRDLLLSLEPGNDLEQKLAAFRFSSERQNGEDDAESLADEPRELILAGLRKGHH